VSEPKSKLGRLFLKLSIVSLAATTLGGSVSLYGNSLWAPRDTVEVLSGDLRELRTTVKDHLHDDVHMPEATKMELFVTRPEFESLMGAISDLRGTQEAMWAEQRGVNRELLRRYK
jgi:hypothetical protein